MILAKKKPASVKMDDLVAIRARLDEARRRRTSIEAAPCDAQELRERIERIVDGSMALAKSELGLANLANEAAPINGVSVALPIHPAGVIGGPTGFAVAPPVPYGFGRAFQSAGLGVLALFMGREVAVERLFAEAEQFVQNGLSAAVRASKLAEVERETRDIELTEEEVVRSLESAGLQPERRADARPEIVLAVDLNKVEAPHVA
ncbi:hypothetical protein ACIKT0_11270 [Hansschlegelia beijingensis]|uniref:hypothetical protein n=1 Tax=Hansschlegelia beijingensis TaxID=1133344 RepID=UPI00387F20AA